MALAVFVLVNAVLLAGYLWSLGGQTTRARVEARGNQFETFVDGELRSRATFANAPAQGGLALVVLDTHTIPSLPEPRGIDWVRVTDLTTGRLLFEDDFSQGYEKRWTVSGRFEDNDGVAGLQGDGTLLLPGRVWTDYAVDVQYRNIVGAAILVRAQDSRTGVVFSLRPFRQDDTTLAVLDQGTVTAGVPSGDIPPARSQAIRSMVAMVLRPYPLIFALLALGLAAVAALQFIPLKGVRRPDDALVNRLFWLAAAGVAAGAFGVALYLMSAYTQRMAHVQDSVAYVFQAKMFASGRLFATPPPAARVFEFETPPFIAVQGGHWASVYSFGHPLALAFGARLGAMWLVPPVLGGASVALVYAIARKVYNVRVGLLAALLLASSPFFFMTASEFMSHNTTAFYLLASLFFLVIADKRPLLYGVLAGLLFGLAFNARQLEVAALAPPFGLLLLGQLHAQERRKNAALQIGGFVAAGLVMLLAYFLFNYLVRGDPTNFGFTRAGFQTEVGFGGKHSVAMGIGNEQTQMAFMVLVLNGWPQQIGLMFVLLPFVLGSRSPWDWFFLACALAVIGVYTLYIGHGIMYGPRYWYPAAPFLMILAARGADRSAALLANAAEWLRGRFMRRRGPPMWAGVLVVYALVAALMGMSIRGWLLSREVGWRGDFVPHAAVSLQGFNGVDDRLVNLIEDAHLKNALVLVDQCGAWQCYGSVFWLNSPGLDGDVVIAKDLPEHRAELFRAYPERRVYLASYQDRFLIPFGRTRPEPGATLTPDARTSPAPLAKDIPIPPTATPTATATPDVGAAGRRDEQRVRDLATIADALQRYHAKHGAFPVASGVQSFCRYRELDAGCGVLEVVAALPEEPSGGSYWYLSDGTTYHLFVSMEGPADSSQCPAPPPPTFAGVAHLYCLRGGP